MKTKCDNKEMHQWVKRWQQAGVELERMHHKDIHQANTRQAIENLDDAFESALRHHAPLNHSGFEQQQALFHRSHV